MDNLKDIDLGEKALKILKNLADFGKLPEGEGEARLLYTKEWQGGQEYLKCVLESKGFTAYYDDIGNLFGRLEGTDCKNETVLTGSHVDTVKNGGILDGQYGIVAGIVAMEYLNKTYGKPSRTIEVVSMAEEEGSRFPYAFWGSKNIFGLASRNEVIGIHDGNMIKFEDAMKECGFKFKDNDTERRNDIKAFVEAHIEQGAVLEKENKHVGIVNSIVGQRRFNIEVTGEPNHAGTTPLKYRKDAMVSASKIINRINEEAWAYGEPLVATVGRVEVTPNIVNVVPGQVDFTLDIRHIDKHMLNKFTEKVMEIIKNEKETSKIEININMWMDESPVPMCDDLVNVIEKQCKDLDVSYKVMHSGAGHDSQVIATCVPTAMIFVPSKDGISHSPLEYTNKESLDLGIKVLIKTIYNLAY